MKLLNLFSSQNTHSSFIFHETFSSNENTAESVDSLETSEDPLDTQEEFDEALEQLEKESISDLDKAANVISIFLSKIEASYEKNGATMSDAYRAQLSKILNNYSSHLAEARALAQKTMDEFEENHDEINDLKEEFNAEKENNPASRKTRRLQEKIGKLEARRDHAKAKARVIYDAINIKAEQNKTMLNSYASHLKLTPSTNEEGPLFEPSAEKVILKKKNEVGIPLTKNIEELNIEVEEDEEISLLPTETVKKLILEDKLSLGLKQLRENGKSYLNSNKDALIKLGVKTFNDSSGGNVEKGGLQGISELQSIIGASPDGIFGPKTKKALESFTAKEKMPPPTKAQYEASLRGYSTQETYDQHLAELAEREKEANTSSKINKKADSSEAKESATKTNVNSTEAGEFGTVKFNENIVKEVKEWPTVGETTLKITDINNDTYHLSLDKEGTPVGSDGFNLIAPKHPYFDALYDFLVRFEVPCMFSSP